MNKLPVSFFEHEHTLQTAKLLIGKVLVSNIDGSITTGIISETEAYLGEKDRASHAFGLRRTTRTEIMFGPAGHVYVYLCYGIHHLFNVVTNIKGVPHAILIRNILPLAGLDVMMKRRNKNELKTLLTGPGTLSQALGINISHNGTKLSGSQIFIEDHGISISEDRIESTPRIGVDYAGEDAALPYRFIYHQTGA